RPGDLEASEQVRLGRQVGPGGMDAREDLGAQGAGDLRMAGHRLVGRQAADEDHLEAGLGPVVASLGFQPAISSWNGMKANSTAPMVILAHQLESVPS